MALTVTKRMPLTLMRACTRESLGLFIGGTRVARFLKRRRRFPRSFALLKPLGRMNRLERIGEEANSCRRSANTRYGVARLLAGLHRLTQGVRRKVLPGARLGQARDYPLRHRAAFCARRRWHGETRLDNDAIENAIRPSCIDRKNGPFFGRPDTGRRSAILYAPIVSRRCHGMFTALGTRFAPPSAPFPIHRLLYATPRFPNEGGFDTVLSCRVFAFPAL